MSEKELWDIYANKKIIETLQELRAEIDREGDYYDTNVDQDVAKGLYKAVQIIDHKISEVSE